MSAEDQEQYVQQKKVMYHFESYSDRWGRLYTEPSVSLGQMDITFRAELARELLLSVVDNGHGTHKRRILDVGCGTGHVLGCLEESRLEIVACDFTEAMVRTAAKAHPHIRFFVADARCLPIGHETFDVVTMMGVMEYITSGKDVIAGVASMLRPGGWLIVSFPNRQSLFRRMHAIERRLTRPIRQLVHRKRAGAKSESAPEAAYLHFQWTEREAVRLLRVNGLTTEWIRYCTYGMKTPCLEGNSLNLAFARWLSNRCGSTGYAPRNLAWTMVLAARKPAERAQLSLGPRPGSVSEED